MRYQAVLFDMDGVLIESEWLMRATAIQALADCGIRAQDEDFMEFTGCGEDRFISGVAERHGAVYGKAMEELASRCQEEADERLSALLSRLEFALVLLLCVAVGLVLLSVMLPLLGVLTAIG